MTRVREHNRHRPYERERLAMTEALLPYDLGAVLVAELESELAKLLPDYGREDIERLRETY